MRVAQTTVAAVVLIAVVAVGVELVRFNEQLGGLPHMSTSQTWQSPNILSSIMFLLIALAAASASSLLLPLTRATLAATSLFGAVALLALWALHRTFMGLMLSGSSAGPISWW